ncbi:unnamed protein product [Blepharisma stoltei]|uniref:Receptor ligand binding region domain-containing protein n=1 Tax=Blepharisma stoltei TaxID=1481888 RepID=A0AAU9JZQ4_9CILI|nr:unnamed protein product [Blepharisma stoltei]
MVNIEYSLFLGRFSIILVLLLPISSYALEVMVYSPLASIIELWESSSTPDLITKLSTSDLHEALAFLHMAETNKILIDLSENALDHFQLSSACEELSIAHFVVEDSLKQYGSWTYSAVSSRENYQSSLCALLKFFNWTEGFIFNSNQNSFLRDSIFALSEDFSSVIIESNSKIDEIIAHLVASSGKSLFYLFTDSYESMILQNALISSKLMIVGNGILLGKESYYQTIVDGSLAITEAGQEFSFSNEDFLMNSINFIISLLNSSSVENSYQLKKSLDSVCVSHFCKSQLSLVNFHNGKRTIVGNLNTTNVSITKPIVFLGNSATVPISSKTILPISINAGTINPGGVPDLNVPIYARGASMVVSMVNQVELDILRNFQMSLFFFDCGATSYDPIYGYSCFKKDIDKFGLGHVGSFPSSVVIGTMATFNQLNVTLPVIGSCNSAPKLNSTELYPWYTRVQLSDALLATDVAPLIKSLGWRSFAILYGNETYGIGCYQWFKQVAEQNGLNILNPEETRAIPPELTREQSADYIDVIKGIYNSNARLVVIFLYSGTTFGYILEHFYDLGARKGDIVFATSSGGIMIEMGFSDQYLYKRYEVGVPMMTFQGSVWVGEFGKSLYAKLKTKYGAIPSDYQCNFFDSTYLLANALDSMINRGQDYTDPYKLNETIRSIKIVGCMGVTSIAHGSNDNEFTTITIDSNQVINGTLSIYHIGLFNPYSAKLLTISQPFIYGDNSIFKPTDLRNEDSDCPFPSSKVVTFTKGRAVVFCICFAIALITAVITYYIWRRWWNVKIETLKEKQEISIQDFVVGVTIGIEFFQIISMGPDFSNIFELLSNFSNAISLNLANIIKLQNGVFWAVCDFVLGLCLLWICLCVTILFQLNERYDFLIFKYLDQFGDFLMPLLGNLCFIPFVSVLLDIFVCDEAIGNNFTDSFLAKDCYQFCWKETHIIYVILSILALITYEPLAVFCRPLWQEFQNQLHVKTLPLFLMIKTVIQVSLIVMNKTIKRAQSTAHAVLFIVVIALYTLFIHKYKPYNYQRYSWWEFITLVAVLWISILAIIHTVVDDSSPAWIVTLFAGWIIIGTYGYLVMRKKYPSLLYRAKGHDTSALFQFAFTFKNTTTKISGKSLNFKSSSKISPGSIDNN